MLTRRSLLSMLSAGIASVAVSTRLAASELRVVQTEDVPDLAYGNYDVSPGPVVQIVLPPTLSDDAWRLHSLVWDDESNERVLRQRAGRAG